MIKAVHLQYIVLRYTTHCESLNEHFCIYFLLSLVGPGNIQPITIGNKKIRIKAQPPISMREPSIDQKLSGAQSVMAFAFEEGDIRPVATDPTKAPVVPPSIGAAAPPLNAVATVAPPAAAIAVTPAFFIVVHPARRITDARLQPLI